MVRYDRSEPGFTLLELLVTLAVAAILLTVGVPGFRNAVMDNRLASEANEFVTAVNLARSSAVRYQRRATVCASTGYDAAVPTCSGGKNWSTGWIVWVDKNRDDVTSANEIIAVREPLYSTSTLTGAATGTLTYDARGFSVSGGDDFLICDSRGGETGRLVNVNNVGRTHITGAGCT